MSIENGLFNRQLKASIGLSSTTGTVFYFTLPWSPQSLIDEIRLTNISGVAFTATALNILDIGAHYRNSTTDGKAHVIFRDATDKNATANEAFWTNWNFNPPIYHDNLYNRPYLNIAVSMTESRVMAPYLTVTGRKSNAPTYQKDRTKVNNFDDYRVLVGVNQTGNGGTGGQIFDVTNTAKGNGGDNVARFGFGTTNDYIYVGSRTLIDHWEFQVAFGATYPANLTSQIWAGAGWSDFTAIDDTSTGNSDTMRFSGIIEGLGIGSSTWTPVVFRPSTNIQLPNDPLTGIADSMGITGTYPIVMLPPNPPRFWARFRVNTSSNLLWQPLRLAKLLPIKEDYTG
jgi:hypothetical protein